MNVHESEKMDAGLSAAGFEKAESDKAAGIVSFNTCCIRNTAEQKIISHIGETKQTGQIICVVGCLSQRDGSAASLKKKFPHIAIILGTHNIGHLAAKLKAHIASKKRLAEIEFERTEQDTVHIGIAASPLAPARYAALSPTAPRNDTAYINITYGCENFCSYCIVPYVRGKLISRDCELIKKEFRDRVRQNKKIIMLLGQNVNSYVCPKTGIDFPTLLERLCEERSDTRSESEQEFHDEAIPTRTKTQINFMSSHPKDFSARLIEVIAANRQIERNIHLPLQSGCDRILALMNRGYTVAQYEAKIKHLRKLVPDVRVTTDIICGFPSETEADFETTIETLKRIRFNAAFIFPYSRRTGTAADKMPDQIDAKTKKGRATALIKLQRGISKTVT